MRGINWIAAAVLLCGVAPARAGELLSKNVCMRMGNSEAACACADQHMKQAVEGQVSARAFQLLQKSDFKTLQSELSPAENQSLTKAMVAANQGAAEACSLARE